MWKGHPPRSRKDDYKSCFDNNYNVAGVDFDRIIALGFCEGPIHYIPWIANPIACIIKTVPTYKELIYLSCVNTLHKYNLPIKLAKNECPSTRCEFVGVLIDTVQGTVAVSTARCNKLRVCADALLTEVDITANASCPDPSPLERSYRRVPSFPGLWSKAMIPRLSCDRQLPLDGSVGFEVITSDASGWVRGQRSPPLRLHRGAAPAVGHLRELFMVVPWTIAEIGARLTGSSVLFRLDKTSSVGAVDKGASPHPDALELLLWLLELLERYGNALIARHIPRQENTLTDCLSRLRGAINDQHWRLLVDTFRALEAACGP
eukprot:jgi/Tetstr1/435640/TSEL_024540.t1